MLDILIFKGLYHLPVWKTREWIANQQRMANEKVYIKKRSSLKIRMMSIYCGGKIMKRLLFLLLTIGLFMSTSSVTTAENPDYEKYGRIAIAVVKEDYPGEEVVEYKYEGRQKISDTDVTDTFVFQVKENDKPLKVIIKISHSLNNNKLLSLTVQEQQG